MLSRFGIAILFAIASCAPHRPLSPVSAGSLAAHLANDRCQKAYGKRPFTPDDFEANLDQGRWHWGTIEGGGAKVDGFEVEVSFDPAGGKRKVMVKIPEE
ncbi:MAG: hypothetical protein JWP91_356 [Fibrobacteres bacterium]|nr:hypothetical protein [Fibrobacterota bacterium]